MSGSFESVSVDHTKQTHNPAMTSDLTGTHWVWEMVQMLQAGEAKYDKRAKENLMLDFMPTEQIDALESPRTLNSHFLFRHLPKQIAQKKIKVIRISR